MQDRTKSAREIGGRPNRGQRRKKMLAIVLASVIVAGAVFTVVWQQRAAAYRFQKSFIAFIPIVETVTGVRNLLPPDYFSQSDNAAVYLINIYEIVHKPGQGLESLRNAVVENSDEIIGLLHKVSLCDYCDFLAAGWSPPRPLIKDPDKYFLASRISWVARTLLKEARHLAERDRDRAQEIMFYLLSVGEHLGGQTLYCDHSLGCGIQSEVCKALAELTKDTDPSQSKTWAEIAEKADWLSNVSHGKGHQMLGRWHASADPSVNYEIDYQFVGAMARCAKDSNDMNLRLLAIDGLTAVSKLRWWSFPGRQARHVLEEIANNRKLGLLADYARESLSLPRAELKKHYRVYSSNAYFFEKMTSYWRK